MRRRRPWRIQRRRPGGDIWDFDMLCATVVLQTQGVSAGKTRLKEAVAEEGGEEEDGHTLLRSTLPFSFHIFFYRDISVSLLEVSVVGSKHPRTVRMRTWKSPSWILKTSNNQEAEEGREVVDHLSTKQIIINDLDYGNNLSKDTGPRNLNSLYELVLIVAVYNVADICFSSKASR
ncbi:hypothetical protein Cni_G26889 [Canna indica]|uniref:Uncharacterized protein n=1 Tax=Canna indica TaxID=4628 RepID=A0AAQ3QMG2_9LILI|nr:hypothetical protein Cni_G26889 [Canna indica]